MILKSCKVFAIKVFDCIKMEKQEIILLNVDEADYVYNFPPNAPLVLGENAMIGLKSIFMWYTFPNISEKYDNNKVRVKYNDQWHNVEIAEGIYEVKDLSDYINRVVVNGSDVPPLGEKEAPKILELGVDRSTFHCAVKLSEGTEIDFSEGKLHELLGLEAKVYNANEKGKTFINITRGLDKVMIRCDLVDRDFQYEYKDVLFDMMPSDAGRAVLMNLDHPIEFYKCKNRNIRSINIRITDQEGKILLLKERVIIKIIIKHVV